MTLPLCLSSLPTLNTESVHDRDEWMRRPGQGQEGLEQSQPRSNLEVKTIGQVQRARLKVEPVSGVEQTQNVKEDKRKQGRRALGRNSRETSSASTHQLVGAPRTMD